MGRVWAAMVAQLKLAARPKPRKLKLIGPDERATLPQMDSAARLSMSFACTGVNLDTHLTAAELGLAVCL